MSKKKRSCPVASNRVGGQAVLEGIMMKHKSFCATAVRCPDGKIRLDKREVKSIREKIPFFKIPILRGVVNFIESMKLSMSTLTLSAEMQGIEEEPTKFEKWLEKKFGKSLMAIAAIIGGALGILLALGLFFFLPMAISKLISHFVTMPPIVKAIVEGVVKMIIFLLYIWLVAFMPDIRKTYEYHGAEHKSIFCHEAGLPLTVENIKKQSRFHPRCGTSMMFMMLLLGIVISTLLPNSLWSNIWLRFLVKLSILPIIVGIGYEITIFSGTHDNFLLRILTAPGLWFQRITTREPDDKEIEVAIVALKASLPEEFDPETVYDGIDGKPDDEAGETDKGEEECSEN